MPRWLFSVPAGILPQRVRIIEERLRHDYGLLPVPWTQLAHNNNISVTGWLDNAQSPNSTCFLGISNSSVLLVEVTSGRWAGCFRVTASKFCLL